MIFTIQFGVLAVRRRGFGSVAELCHQFISLSNDVAFMLRRHGTFVLLHTK